MEVSPYLVALSHGASLGRSGAYDAALSTMSATGRHRPLILGAAEDYWQEMPLLAGQRHPRSGVLRCINGEIEARTSILSIYYAPRCAVDLDQFGIRRSVHPIHHWGSRVGDLSARPRLCGVQFSGKGTSAGHPTGLWPTITPGMSAEQELRPRVNSMTIDQGRGRGNRSHRQVS
jgi:hypothetical protein